MSQFTLDTSLRKRIIGTRGEKRTGVMLGRVHPIRIEQNHPVRRAALTELVGVPAQDAGDPTGRLRRAEHGCEEAAFYRPLTWPFFGLTLGEVPVRSGGQVLPQLWFGRPVLRIEGGTRTREVCPQLVAARRRRMCCCVGRRTLCLSHRLLLSNQLACGRTTG